MIAGNHDVTLDEPFYARKWSRFHSERCNHLSQEDSPDGFVPPPASARTLFYGNNLGIIALENSGTSLLPRVLQLVSLSRARRRSSSAVAANPVRNTRSFDARAASGIWRRGE
jgi:hypothetical protein